MSLFSSISGIAKSVTGTVSGIRKVMSLDPSSIPFVLPPQISMGIKAAGIIGNIVGIKVPTEAQLKDLALGKAKTLLSGVLRPVSSVLDAVDGVSGKVLTSVDKASTDLSQIDWLL